MNIMKNLILTLALSAATSLHVQLESSQSLAHATALSQEKYITHLSNPTAEDIRVILAAHQCVEEKEPQFSMTWDERIHEAISVVVPAGKLLTLEKPFLLNAYPLTKCIPM